MADKYNFLNFTVFDFETTGLDSRTEQIVEACVIRVRDGVPVSVYNTLVQLNEGKVLPSIITEITGHNEADLMGGISEKSLAYLLWGMFEMDNGGKEVIVAYNALFDMSFLEALFAKHINLDFYIENPFIDPLTIARHRDPYPHKLADSCRRHGIELDDAHSAYADTFALVDLVIDQHKKEDISEWLNVAGYRPKYGEPTWYPAHTKLIKQGAEVIEHSKKATTKPKVKPPAVLTKNKRKKAYPDDPKKEFKDAMPTAFIDKGIKDKIDNFLDDPFNTDDMLELTVLAEGDNPTEFNNVMEYLIKVRQVPDNCISSWLDNPGEAVIELYKRAIRPIDINDEDLPF